MKSIRCECCGGDSFIEKDGYRVCCYCKSKMPICNNDFSIELNDDVKRLLKKCADDPKNACRYANLILDIDPTNTEALKYLKRKMR